MASRSLDDIENDSLLAEYEADIADLRTRTEQAEAKLKEAGAHGHGCGWAACAKLDAIGEAWRRYQRNDIIREEFEGVIAERVETTGLLEAKKGSGT